MLLDFIIALIAFLIYHEIHFLTHSFIEWHCLTIWGDTWNIQYYCEKNKRIDWVFFGGGGGLTIF